MATEAQIKANRQNAKKSTGPRTARGKRRAGQNALRHGLFGRETTIHGESNEEYDRHREAFLDELRPIGMAESVLAERIVTLSWRLKRAERMENQATDMLLIRCGGEVPDTAMVLAIPHEVRKVMVDATTLGRDLSLGQAAIRDFSYFRVIEKVTLYARRMENNLIKTMKELKKLQLMRIIAQADAAKQQSAEARRVAATERTSVSEVDGIPQDNAARHPLHSLRSFSGCHTTGEEPQSTGEIAPAETNGSELKKQTQSPASEPKPETQRAVASERTLVGEVDGLRQENADACRPLHPLRSFSGCQPTEAQNSEPAPFDRLRAGSEQHRRIRNGRGPRP